ncbi:DUF3072 domain-containing protein [Roseobacter sp. CCS2]|uniref:DUF3072 domain-containing protein n=1 Tax=Roseobacter sp. CCS2 TaxID=391593 RepID=UPI0000F401FD|nr:DUF3072 domain-containing protein [Roseobacter sp. CCS2]EBA12984.1 hypothetical protein RCCS2_03844 [Roseobacter sp. CCS2]
MPTKPIVVADEMLPDDAHDADAPMTAQQADILRALCESAGEPFDGGLTQAAAHERIELLREQVNDAQNL